MNPLLCQLEDSGAGQSVDDFYAGGFLHANDIRTLASSLDSLEKQVSIVDKFANENFLKLNIQKCEIVPFSLSSKPDPVPHCEVDGAVVPVSSEAKCLGYWWRRDLMASRSVAENIGKARRSLRVHAPPILTPWQVAPQPRREAAVCMTRSG